MLSQRRLRQVTAALHANHPAAAMAVASQLAQTWGRAASAEPAGPAAEARALVLVSVRVR